MLWSHCGRIGQSRRQLDVSGVDLDDIILLAIDQPANAELKAIASGEPAATRGPVTPPELKSTVGIKECDEPVPMLVNEIAVPAMALAALVARLIEPSTALIT